MRGTRAAAAGAFIGAILATVATAAGAAPVGAAPVGAAPAETRPSYSYSSMLTAVGLRTQLDSNPEPSSVPDLTDVETPESDGQLDSFGTEDASGHVGNLNGLGNVPGLICEATGGTPFDCSTIPTGGTTSFPPPDPLDAHADYPTPTHAVAPSAAGQAAQASIATGPLTGSAGTASADVGLTTTSTRATLADVGVDSLVTIGSVTTSSTQQVDGASLRSHAEASLSGINIGNGLAGTGFIGISSVDITSDTTSAPATPGSDVTSAVIAGVTVLGQPATIDSTGVHITRADNVPAGVTSAYQQLLNNDLSASGISIRAAGVTRTDDVTGHTVDAGGLLVTINSNVSGAPSVNVGLPAGVPCPIQPIADQLPIDPCAGVGFSVDAAYYGNIYLGETGILSNSQPDTLIGSLGSVGGSGLQSPTLPGDQASGATPAPGATSSTAPAPNGATSVPAPVSTAGQPDGTPVAAGTLPGGAAPTGTGGGPPSLAAGVPGSAAPPGQVTRQATRDVSLSDPLAGSTRRLLYLFPMMILVGIGILAGHLRRVPPRIPGNGS